MDDETIKGPGRPKINIADKRSRHVSVRLTEAEYKEAVAKLQFDESLSDFFRRLFVNKNNNN